MTLVNMLEKRLVNLLEKRLVIWSMRLQIRDLTEDLAGDVLEVMVVVIPADQSDVLIPEDQSDVLIPEDQSDVLIPEDQSDVLIPEDQSDVLIPEDQSHVLEVTVVLIPADVLVTTHVILS
jgi:hypothetical protein